jgi:hypothetical protein
MRNFTSFNASFKLGSTTISTAAVSFLLGPELIMCHFSRPKTRRRVAVTGSRPKIA